MTRRGLALLLLCAACHRPFLVPTVPASAALVETPSWRAQTAEHRVAVTVRLDKGGTEQRSMRGVVAVQRPDRLRLRALGPAGITLFDLLVTDGRPRVLSALRGPGDGGAGHALSAVIASLAQDLACAYDLGPRPVGRKAWLDAGIVVVEEPGRTVRLSRFSGTPPTWRRAEIETEKYSVTVDVDRVEIDPALDPSLFAD